MSDLLTELQEAHRESPSWRLFGLCHQAATRIIELETKLAERVRVKPLEWRDKSGSEYEVRWDGIGIGVHYVAKAVKCDDLILCCGKYHTDINEAKAAAQADYDRRILSTLEATPPAPKVTEAQAEVVAKLITRWLGRSWEGLPEGRVTEKGFPVFSHSQRGWGFNGRKGDMIDLAHEALTAAQEAGNP